jgi:hypothetical protein
MPNLRGTGRTTKQMEALPKGSIFISCCHQAVYYDKQLTRKLERPDIVVVPPSWVTSMKWRGQSYPGIALDHYYFTMNKNNPLFNTYLDQARARIRR